MSEYIFKDRIVLSVVLFPSGVVEAEILSSRASDFLAKKMVLSPEDLKKNIKAFGDPTLFDSLSMREALGRAAVRGFSEFITEHIKKNENVNVSMPYLIDVDIHLELNRFQGVLNIALVEQSDINTQLKTQDKMIAWRIFYAFDELFREINQIPQVPTSQKQKYYDEHLDGLATPYMRADNVPDMEDRKLSDLGIELEDITQFDDESLLGSVSDEIKLRQQIAKGEKQIETMEYKPVVEHIKQSFSFDALKLTMKGKKTQVIENKK